MFSPSFRRLTLACLLAPLGVGCSAQSAASDDGPTSQNQCNADTSCPTGECHAGMCVSQSTTLETLLLEVTPPTGSSDAVGTSIAGVRFTQVMRDVASVESYDISLGYVGKVHGSVHGAPFGSACVPANDLAPAPSDDSSLPARVTLVPRDRLLGLSNPVASTTTSLANGSYAFSLDVPPGNYDVYVEPTAADAGCVRSPYLVVDQAVPQGSVDLNVTVPAPSKLSVVVRWPHMTDDLSGWKVDIVERDAGRLLSNQVVLGSPTKIDGGLEYTSDLAFTAVVGDGDVQVDEIVRLSPPNDVVAPTVFVQRSVVELFQGGRGLIDQLTQLPNPVRVAGQVNPKGTTAAAPATVSVTATNLSAVSPGTVAAFSRTVATTADGSFEVDLLPGDYRISVVPAQSGLAAIQQALTVGSASDVQKGLVFEVPQQQDLAGTVVDFRGKLLGGVLVQASPPLSDFISSVVDIANASGAFVPRSAVGNTDGKGAFRLAADSGSYDVVAQPADSAELPWVTRLGVKSTAEAPTELEPFVASVPRVLSGLVVSEDIGVVPSALIRAYVYVREDQVTSDPARAKRLVPVAETRSDSSGQYRLLLPSSLE